jgi:hypothetical protein
MNLTKLSKTFFDIIEKRIGPFDRPFQFRPFPFDSGGALNFLTVGAGREKFVTYVSWDLFGHEEQKRGKIGRFELLTSCDTEQWCVDVITNVGRQTLVELFEPGDTMDISAWGTRFGLDGIIFEEVFCTKIRIGLRHENCGLLRCIGITKSELEFAREHGSQALIECLKRNGIYPTTIPHRPSIKTDGNP